MQYYIFNFDMKLCFKIPNLRCVSQLLFIYYIILFEFEELMGSD